MFLGGKNMNEKTDNKTTKTKNAKLKLTGFQRMCLQHSLGVDYEYEHYEDRGRLTAKQCEDADGWIWNEIAMHFPYGEEKKWKSKTITIPADMIEAVWYVLDNALEASVMLADGEMYHNMRCDDYSTGMISEELADSIIERTSYSIAVKLNALKELI